MGIGRQYVAAVDLLDENEVFLKKSDCTYYALGIQILVKAQFFNEQREFQERKGEPEPI